MTKGYKKFFVARNIFCFSGGVLSKKAFWVTFEGFSVFALCLFPSERSFAMEISTIRGFTELGMEDPSFINQWQMNTLDDLILSPLASTFGESINHPFSTSILNHKASIMDTCLPDIIPPTKQLKPNGFNAASKVGHVLTPQPAFSPVLSFTNSNHANQMVMAKPKEENVHFLPSEVMVSQGSFANQDMLFKAYQGDKRISTSSRISQDHNIAERKRREQLSQRFIALSAIVPGLKKMDKASVLGDAIKYLKQLQERVKTLEEQTRKKTMESVVIVKKSQFILEGQNSSTDESSSRGPLDETLPEIEARFCEKHVLIRIHCEKRKGMLEKMITEIEKLHLTVINSSVLTFGSSALDVTIIAQMELEFSMSVKDLVKNLLSSFESFM